MGFSDIFSRTKAEIEGPKDTPPQVDNTRVVAKEPKPLLSPKSLSNFPFSKNNPEITISYMAKSASIDPTMAFAYKVYMSSLSEIKNGLESNYGELQTDDSNEGSTDNNGESADNKPKGSLSLKEALINNGTLPYLLTSIYTGYSSTILSDKRRLERRIQKKLNNEKKDDEKRKDEGGAESGETGRVQLFEEYLLENNSNDAFRKYLYSSECIEGVLLPYLEAHTDRDGNLKFVSQRDLNATIRAAWQKQLHDRYITTYQITPNEKYLQISEMGNFIKNTIDGVILNYLKAGGDNDGKGLPEKLDLVVGKILNSDLIKGKIGNEEFMAHFDDLLRNNIRAYIGNDVSEKELKHTDDPIFDLNLRTYLYLYGKYFYSSVFNPKGGSLLSYESDLADIRTAILYHDGNIEEVKYNKYLKAEEERAKAQELLQRQARAEAFKRNKERNSGIKSGHSDIESRPLTENGGSIDLNNASGSQIAQGWELGRQITQFDKETSIGMSESDKAFLNGTAFHETASIFFERNEKLKNFIPISDFKKFFNITKDGISFNDKNWDSFKNDWIQKNGNMDNESLNEIEDLLKIGFINEFYNSVKALTLSCKDRMGDVRNIVKDHAIGAVIDNIKDVFDNLVRTNTSGLYFEGFKYNESEPVKIDGDIMVISGHFRGEALNLSYNVKTGELKMSEYIHNLGDKEGSGFVIGSTEPTLSIGTIESFDKILESFYSSPTSSLSDGISKRFGRQRSSQANEGNNNEGDASRDRQASEQRSRRGETIRQMKSQADRLRLQQICGTKIDEIGTRIREELGKHTTENSIISGVLKTFGITSKYKTVNFVENSDFYRFTQIVKNSDQQSLNDFLAKMPKFMKILGLNWGEEIDQRKDQGTDVTDSIRSFSEEGDKEEGNEGDIISYLQKHSTNFNNEKKAVASAQFDKPINFGILNVFNEKFTSENSNNGKILSWKMNELMIQIDDAFSLRGLL